VVAATLGITGRFRSSRFRAEVSAARVGGLLALVARVFAGS
jgi:hypothetical protein